MENKTGFLGIPGVAWAAGGLLLILVALGFMYFTSSGSSSFFR